MSDDLKKSGSLLALTVVGPRWNCHALLATLSPIPVRERLSVDLAGLCDGSESWSLVLYNENMTTMEWVGSATANKSIITWRLPRGRYLLSLRYYTDTDELRTPAVTADDCIFVCGSLITGEARRYGDHLEAIRNRSSFYYRLLHYYVFFYLKYGTRDVDWLRGEFLPVGNPDTNWYYGHLAAGEQLGIRFDSTHEHVYSTYLTFYNWASFPVYWTKIQPLEWRSASFSQDVGYVVRRVRKKGSRETQNSEGIFHARVYPQGSRPFQHDALRSA